MGREVLSTHLSILICKTGVRKLPTFKWWELSEITHIKRVARSKSSQVLAVVILDGRISSCSAL